jgi:mono/diheme cytochrome c family protein
MALFLATLACKNTGTLGSFPGAQAPLAAPEPGPVEDGRSIFLANCTGCHGKSADGNTPAGRAWQVPNLRADEVQSLPDQQLLEIIGKGKGRMPAWDRLLSSIDKTHVLAYIRSLRNLKTP